MLRRVALVRSVVTEEHSSSIIRVARIGELGTTLRVINNRLTLRRMLHSSETSFLTRAARRNIPDDGTLHSHRYENLKSYTGGDLANRVKYHSNFLFVFGMFSVEILARTPDIPNEEFCALA
jgi:hypothetical protein